jgi:uncharacterized RDD family membrane protein YckC
MVMFYDGVILLGLLMLASAVALPFGETEKMAFRDLGFTSWLLLVCFFYLAACWRYGGMTVGMRAWRVQIISREGERISWLACLLRFLTGLLSVTILGLGVFWALIDKKNRGWHDLASRTLLIKYDKA